MSESRLDSDNVHIFTFVRQLQVLKHADVFITHGGLNSIREAVHTEVPMLLFPVHPEYYIGTPPELHITN